MTTQVSFATRSLGPLQEVTERRPGLAIDAYPLGRLLLLRCFGDVEGIDTAAEINGSGGKVLHATRSGDEVTLLLDGSGREEEIIASLADQSAHLIPPIRWQRGEARVTLVLEDGANPEALLDQFPGARLVSKRRPMPTHGDRGAYSSPLFLHKLTEKQARALLAAYGAGYYEFPRKATTEEISQSLGIARSTFEQHLNRAEHHVVRAMLPMVRMRSGLENGEALEVYSKFSRELGLYVQLEVLGDRVAAVRLTRKAPVETAGSDHPYLARILEHIHTGKGDLRDIPLALEVAPFEREVLEFLRTIPPGETITYGEIARRLGRPGASRAVGTACARNPVVIVIPCHRVVPKSGGLGNYSSEGGPETKRRLLEREGARVGLEMKPHEAPGDRKSRTSITHPRS
ncbi:MAG TPA: methylated-DNA--[protein]-cysteine S-methyltransferase [Thermoplasmata archaeon]|nr:methylated-DNA--[protein]-cysteine S-methyltransferase [Thermoplasmata archaeon]